MLNEFFKISLLEYCNNFFVLYLNNSRIQKILKSNIEIKMNICNFFPYLI